MVWLSLSSFLIIGEGGVQMIIEQLMRLINRRTSIRSFTEEEIPDENLRLIAEAGRASSTDSNKQLRKFTIVKNTDLLKNLAQAIGEEIEIGDYDFYGATAILLISVPRDSRNSCYEVGLAVQNSWLAATALGLGMAWTHQINGYSDHPGVRQALDALAIPSNHICLNVLALGIPTEQPEPKMHIEEIHLFK